MLICVQAPFTRTFDNKDRPWTPAVRRVAEPVMWTQQYSSITRSSEQAPVPSRPTLIAFSHARHRRGSHALPTMIEVNHRRSNPLVPPPATLPSLCVVDYPLFLVA